MRDPDLEAAYARLGERLYRYAEAILGSGSEAEEIVQDLFVELAERKTADWPRDLDGYLLTSARNAALKRLGRGRRRLELLREGAVLLIPRTPEPGLEDLAAEASDALKALPVEQREAVALHLFENLSFREIGELTGIPADTAASRYRYGLAKLKEVLGHAR